MGLPALPLDCQNCSPDCPYRAASRPPPGRV